MDDSSSLEFLRLTAREMRDHRFMERFYYLDSAARSGNGEMQEHYAQATVLGTVAVAILDEDQMIGTIMLDEDMYRGAQWLESLAVHPDYRSAGVGRAAMGYVEDFTRERGCDEVRLNAQPNPRTLGFYRRLGYHTLSTEGKFEQMHKILSF